MRTRILALVVLTLATVTTSFANTGDKISAKALTTFTEKFSDVKDVMWSKADLYYKVTFTMNEQVLMAFISEKGEWIGVSRNLLSSQLPINLQASLKKDFNQYWITELFELATDSGTVYYAA